MIMTYTKFYPQTILKLLINGKNQIINDKCDDDDLC